MAQDNTPDSDFNGLLDIFDNRTTYTILTQNLVLELPDGWYISNMIVEGNTLLVLAPIEHFIWERWSADVPFVIVNRFSLEELGIADADNPPVAAIEVYDEESFGNSFGEITPFEFDNRPAAMTEAIYPQFDNRFVLLMIDENNFITLNIYAPSGTINEVMEEILSIIETATLLSDSGVNIEINVELIQTRLSDDEEYVFDYPENWVIEGNDHRQTLVGNIEAVGDTEIVFKFDGNTSIEDVCTYFDELPYLYTELHYIFNIGCFTVNGREVVRLMVTDEYRIFNLYEYAIEIESGVFLHFSIYQPPYENPKFEETIFAMLTSVRQNP